MRQSLRIYSLAWPIFVVGVVGNLLLFFACSTTGQEKDSASEDKLLATEMPEPFWLKVDERFSFTDRDGNYLYHPFFDNGPFVKMQEASDSEKIFAEPAEAEEAEQVINEGQELSETVDVDELGVGGEGATEADSSSAPDPAMEVAQQSITEQLEITPVDGKLILNFFVTTPADSAYLYDFDLVSGKLFTKFKYCEQKDIWKNYKSTIERPMFTSGIVPRILDQLGHPQQIIVFGNDDFFKKTFDENSDLPMRQAKIVGGVVEQYCEVYPCSSSGEWLSRQIMVAVSVDDQEFFEVDNLEQLKRKVDWPEVLAFLQNGQGRAILNSVSYVGAREERREEENPAFRYIGEISVENVITYANKVGHIFGLSELQALRSSCHKLYDFLWSIADKAKLKKLQKMNIDNASLFAANFGSFYSKYGKELAICSKYVRAANINQSIERHWFFAFLSGFIKLTQQGNIYFCNQRVWTENIIDNNGKLQFNPAENYKSCTDTDMEFGFNMMSSYLEQQQKAGRTHLRYITYDSGIGRTHNKLYSWAQMSGKRLSCTDKKEQEVADLPYEIFPKDVRWTKLDSSATRDDLIY